MRTIAGIILMGMLAVGCGEDDVCSMDNKNGGGEICASSADCPSGLECISLQCKPACHPNCARPAGLKWVSIPGGTFTMGCSPSDTACESDEYPPHSVTLSGFQMLETEVTEAQYEAVMGENPSCSGGGGGGADNPVEFVDWANAKVFCEAIGGRLPTEAEWEYAARGGTETRYYCGDDSKCLSSVAWYGAFQGPKHPVKQKEPNAYGLYDMLGNVWEWTNDWSDWNGESYYESSPSSNPQGPESGTARVTRGGHFGGENEQLRVSLRHGFNPSWFTDALGFRCAKSE